MRRLRSHEFPREELVTTASRCLRCDMPPGGPCEAVRRVQRGRSVSAWLGEFETSWFNEHLARNPTRTAGSYLRSLVREAIKLEKEGRRPTPVAPPAPMGKCGYPACRNADAVFVICGEGHRTPLLGATKRETWRISPKTARADFRDGRLDQADAARRTLPPPRPQGPQA